ncbi:MAG: hypothetical protein H0X66_12505 [Verrucomicrobia bacterium]|nr:hypothetical protein [Verrucomicrobiota bacterium]
MAASLVRKFFSANADALACAMVSKFVDSKLNCGCREKFFEFDLSGMEKGVGGKKIENLSDRLVEGSDFRRVRIGDACPPQPHLIKSRMRSIQFAFFNSHFSICNSPTKRAARFPGRLWLPEHG